MRAKGRLDRLEQSLGASQTRPRLYDVWRDNGDGTYTRAGDGLTVTDLGAVFLPSWGIRVIVRVLESDEAQGLNPARAA